MTEHTTPITVHLTDEQMDDIVRGVAGSGGGRVLRDAIKAQRPRPIVLGDKVKVLGQPHAGHLTVEAVKGGTAWVWRNGRPYGSHFLCDLTRVDEEAKP